MAEQGLKVGWRFDLIAVLLLGLTVYGLLGAWTDGFIGHPYGDMPDHVWGNEWFAQELREGRWPRWVEDNHFPTGGVLWHIDPLGGLFRRMFLFLPPNWVWNAYVSLLLFALGWVVYRWGYRLGLSWFESMCLGVIALFNPYVSGLIHSGLTEYMGLAFGVLLVDNLQQERWRRVGFWLMVLGVQSFVVGLMASLYCLLHLCFLMVFARGKSSLKAWLQVALPSALVVVPLAVLCMDTLSDPQAMFTPNDAPGWQFSRLPAVDIIGFLPPGDWVHPDTRQMNPGIVQNHSLGWGWFLVLGLSCWKHRGREWLSDSKGWLAFSILALGPRLSFFRWMPLGGSLLLPLSLLYLPWSPFTWVHHPYHMVMFVWIGSIPIVVMGLRKNSRWIWSALIVLTLLEARLGSVPSPMIHTHFAEDVSVEGPRLDFPPDHSTANRSYLIQQLKHREPIAYGINQWMPKQVFTDPGMQRWLRLLDDPVKRSQNRDQPPLPLQWLSPSDERTQLKTMGFDWLVVHLQFLSDNEQDRLRSQLQSELGVPSVQSDDVWVYELSEHR